MWGSKTWPWTHTRTNPNNSWPGFLCMVPAVKGRSQKDTSKAENAEATKPDRCEMLQYEV